MAAIQLVQPTWGPTETDCRRPRPAADPAPRCALVTIRTGRYRAARPSAGITSSGVAVSPPATVAAPAPMRSTMACPTGAGPPLATTVPRLRPTSPRVGRPIATPATATSARLDTERGP